jgi:hypothetical protein
MARRPPSTLTDYLLVGITPALIMLLIGSFVFFLIAVFYHGEYTLRINFIFAMFIMGAVAVGRISMEEGTEYASMFAAPLALAMLFVLYRFGHLGLAPFVALIWWLAYQLTWDCTLLDERADTSDQGLLQAVGVSEETPGDENTAVEDAIDPRLASVAISERDDEPAAWMKWLKRSKKPHAHGVWVIYFSLAALPLFGLGQWFLPTDSRRYAFLLLVVYVAAALGLLLSTSFLGLRCYLRRRRLEMPLEMTATWLGVGGAIIVAVLLLCLLLPRPGAEVAVSQLPITITTPNVSPSRWSIGNDGQKNDANSRASGEGKKNEGEPSADDNQQAQGHATPGGDKGSSQGKNGNGQPKDGDHTKQSGGSKTGKQSSGGEQKSSPNGEKSKAGEQGEKSQQQQNGGESQKGSSGEKTNDQASQSQQQSQQQGTPQQQPTSPPPSQPATPPHTLNPAPLLSSLGSLVKLLLYAVVLGVIAFLAWRYRQELLAAWQQLLKELRELWERLFGGKVNESAVAEESAATKMPVRRPFASFSDPFATGQATRMNRLELLRYSFEALQAWGRERGCPREESETPHEYAGRLAMSSPHLASEAAALAEFYGIAAYGGGMLPASFGEPLRGLWVKMNSAVRQVPVG